MATNPSIVDLTAANIVIAMDAGTLQDKDNLAIIECPFLDTCIDDRIMVSPGIEDGVEGYLSLNKETAQNAFGQLLEFAFLPA